MMRAGGRAPDYVWIIEQDVGVSGDILPIIEGHSESNADLLVIGVHDMESDWIWRKHSTPKYLWLIPDQYRLKCQEQFQRISATLMKRLIATSDEGLIAWSEAAVPSIAFLYGHSIGPIESAFIGKIFRWDTDVTETEWDEFVATDVSQGRSRLYHALKF